MDRFLTSPEKQIMNRLFRLECETHRNSSFDFPPGGPYDESVPCGGSAERFALPPHRDDEKRKGREFMKFSAKAVSVQKVQKEAEDMFRNGFFCSEAVLSTIRRNFEVDVPEEIVAMASGFPVGIGRSKCVCGALSGGVMALGMFFGRTVQKDPKVEKNLEVAKELHDWFKEANGKGVTCCRILTREFDMAKGEHKEQCIRYTGLVAGKVAEIVIREFGLTNLDEETAV